MDLSCDIKASIGKPLSQCFAKNSDGFDDFHPFIKLKLLQHPASNRFKYIESRMNSQPTPLANLSSETGRIRSY